MIKPLTTMIVDGLTWYSEDDWKALVADNAKLGNDLSALQARIEELEAKLAKAVEALSEIKSDLEDRDYNSAYLICKHTIAELTGGKDD